MKLFISIFLLPLILLSCAGNDSLPDTDIDVKTLFPTTLSIPSSKPFLEISQLSAQGYIDLIDINFTDNQKYDFIILYRDTEETTANFIRYFSGNGAITIRQSSTERTYYEQTITENYFTGSKVHLSVPSDMIDTSISTDTCIYGSLLIQNNKTFDYTARKNGYYQYDGTAFKRIGVVDIRRNLNNYVDTVYFADGVDCWGNPVDQVTI